MNSYIVHDNKLLNLYIAARRLHHYIYEKLIILIAPCLALGRVARRKQGQGASPSVGPPTNAMMCIIDHVSPRAIEMNANS